jgi:hypothetical protein
MNGVDLPSAVSFLQRWEPDGPWLLTAIKPDSREIETRRFTDPDEVLAWLQRHEGARNIYFSVNRPRPGLRGRAKKQDISHLLALHVDLDPPKTPGLDLAAAQAEIRAKLEQANPPPTDIIASGNGFQGFWRLDEPVEVDDGEHSVERLESYNKALAQQLGADYCHNIDRIMRLPGTTNLPDAKKRALGRRPVAAELIYLDLDRRYRLDDFPASANANGRAGAANGNGRGTSLFDPGQWITELLRIGRDPNNPQRCGGGCSKAVFAAACGLVSARWDDEAIAEALLNPQHGISAHVRDQQQPAQLRLTPSAAGRRARRSLPPATAKPTATPQRPGPNKSTRSRLKMEQTSLCEKSTGCGKDGLIAASFICWRPLKAPENRLLPSIGWRRFLSTAHGRTEPPPHRAMSWCGAAKTTSRIRSYPASWRPAVTRSFILSGM